MTATMKRLIALIIFIALILTACGAVPSIMSVIIPPDTVHFSCLSVDNDTTCTGIQESHGVWDSGPVQTTGNPMPVDYLNIEITNNGIVNTSIFAYSDIRISNCWDDSVASEAVDLAPGETVVLSTLLWNYRCGALGYQDSFVSLYNASGFDPSIYPDPLDYPRTDMIANALIYWENRLPGDMP